MKRLIFTAPTGTPTLRATDRVAAGGEDPVAEPGLGQHVAGEAVRPSHQTIDIGMPATKGMPSLRVAIQPCAPIQWKSPVRMWPLNRPPCRGPARRRGCRGSACGR